METLVLNYAWAPVQRVPWQQAISDVWTGRAEIIEAYADKFIRAVDEVFPMPSVIRFVTKRIRRKRRRFLRFNRKNVWLRDKGRCCYCNVKVSANEFTYDHVVPRTQGGKTTWENIVVACLPCNTKKGGRTPQQAGMGLLRKPHRPQTLAETSWVGMVFRPGMPSSWKDYLRSVTYWNSDLDE